MFVLADNLNVRNKTYREAVKKKDKKAIEIMAKELASKGADMINVQVSLDGVGDEDTLPMATEAVQRGSGLPLCLDSRNVKALTKAVPLCAEPPIINYLSADEKDPDELLTSPSFGRPDRISSSGHSRAPCPLRLRRSLWSSRT